MSKVSKLVIKACSDNKFSSFTGEFITSINPENLAIKSAVSYHVPEGMSGANLLKYRGSPPKLLSFSLLFDNTGIMPGSNAIAVMEQVKQLQDVAYSVHKKNNAPNYIRVIWGQIDFKGRLVALDIVYSMFQVDGTLVRAEAHISVLEELVPLGKGKAAAGVDSNYTKPSGANATASRKVAASQATSNQEAFAPTPNGMSGAYSGAPPGAYDGGPDAIYHGSNGTGGAVYSASTGATPSGGGLSTVGAAPSSNYDAGYDAGTGRSASYSANPGAGPSGNSLKGGVAGNGPGGSGGGVGGGGHGPALGASQSGSAASGGSLTSGSGQSGRTTPPAEVGSHSSKAGTSGSSHGVGSGAAGSTKSNAAAGSVSGGAGGKGSGLKAGSIAAAGVASSAAAAAAAANGADSLRKLKANVNLMQTMKNKVSFWRRLKNFAKKTCPKAYDAGKKVVKSSGF